MTTERSAAFFDLDKTVIARSSVLALARSFYLGGLLDRRTVVRSAVNQILFVSRGANHRQMERARAHLSLVTAGWEVQQVRDIVAGALHELIGPMVYAEAVQLIAEHHAAGREVVLVSTSGEEIVRPIGDLLGVDRVIASRMTEVEGRWTGAVSEYVYGPTKAVAVTALAAEQGWDLAGCYAYSDSVTDVPLLSAVGHPVAVNPDRGLRRVARQQGWPVRTFERPVAVGRRRRPSSSAVGATAVVAAAGAAWLVLRARHRD